MVLYSMSVAGVCVVEFGTKWCVCVCACACVCVLPTVVGLMRGQAEHAKVLIHSITINCALPALDWGPVLCSVLHSDICGQFVYVVAKELT